MSILKKIFGTSENEFSIGLGANRVRLINNSKTLEIKDKDSAVIPLAISQIALPSTLTDKTTPVDADVFPGGDSAASGVWKKFTWANIKAAIGSAFMAAVSPGDSGNVLTSNGSAWVSQTPSSGTIILKAVKTANETVNNSSTYQDDDHLTVTVEANSTYIVKVYIQAIAAHMDYGIKAQFVLPTSATTGGNTRIMQSEAVGYLRNITTASWLTDTAGQAPNNNTAATFEYDGVITTSSTAGTVKIQWAQAGAHASDTTFRLGSYIILTKI